jgi:hypothetical protein
LRQQPGPLAISSPADLDRHIETHSDGNGQLPLRILRHKSDAHHWK